MGQVSSTLRRIAGGYAHWCPGCEEMHKLPDGWSFDGNLEQPTFSPSFKHEGMKRIFADGKWTGEWARDASSNTIPAVCHYILTAGVLNFCGDSTHSLAGQSVPLPALPEGLTDARPEASDVCLSCGNAESEHALHGDWCPAESEDRRFSTTSKFNAKERRSYRNDKANGE